MRALALIALFAVGGCFKVEEPACAFSCGPNDACPDDYECRSDGYCHKVGSTAACEFSDAAPSPDLSVGDMAIPDMLVPTDMAVAVPMDLSMSVPPDLTEFDM